MPRDSRSSRPLSISEILEIIERRAPASTAEDWDSVGLLAGDPKWKTRGAVVSIDLTEEAIDLAKKKGFRLVITHHPCIFPKKRGLGSVTPRSLVFRAIRSGIAVVACHTNFDRCALEVVKTVAHGLGAAPFGRLMENEGESLLKLAVFVPLTHLKGVRDAVFTAGAGQVGNYDQCSFGVNGEGTFRGSEKSRPFIGRPGKMEKTTEVRFETVLPRGLRETVVAALLKAHPYEEVAYDLYELAQAPGRHGVVRGMGYGFWGEFPSPKPFSDLEEDVRRIFQLKGFWLTDPPPTRVKRIAYVAGKGAAFLDAAIRARCDVFITGEVGYHVALEGKRRGLAVMELGHRESERFFPKTMEGWLLEAGLRAVESSQATQKIWFSGGKK